MNRGLAKTDGDGQRIEEMLVRSPKTPSLAGVASLVQDLQDLGETDVTQLHGMLVHDEPIATEIVRIVNAQRGPGTNEIRSLRDAVLFLGVSPVRNIALSLGYFTRFREQVIFRRGVEFLWRTSLMTGVAARRLAIASGGWDAEEAFLAGLIADCAVLVMYRVVPGYRDVIERFRMGDADLIPLERGRFETDHARIAARLLGVWGFEEELRAVIAAQHRSEALSHAPELFRRARILEAAWLCSRALTVPGYGWETQWLSERAGELIDVPASRLGDLGGALGADLEKEAATYGVAAGS